MKRLVLVLALVLLAAGGWWLGRPERPPPGQAAPSRRASDEKKEGGRSEYAQPAPPSSARPLTAAEKAARIEQIKRDYDEVRAKIAAEYSAAGAKFPGGLHAFLRQLALLEREKRADFAAFLSAAELEDLEYRETSAGQLVTRLLAGTAAAEELKRAVFRKQLAYEDRFALTLDISPPALLEREAVRQALQMEIRSVLGDALFADWLRGEGADFTGMARLVAEHRLPVERLFELWQTKNEFVHRRLELNARTLPAEQKTTLRRDLVREINARVDGLLGTTVPEPARREALGWLPVR